jgi:hypothetical protein
MVTVYLARVAAGNHAGKIAPPRACRFCGEPFASGNVFEQIIAFAGERWIMAGG